MPHSVRRAVHTYQHVPYERGVIPGVRVARAAQPYDYEIVRGHDRYKLPLVTCGAPPSMARRQAVIDVTL
jgi:hypothetical protein